MRNLLLFLLFFIFLGCAKQSYTLNELNLALDLNFTQNASILPDTTLSVSPNNNELIDKYFSVWDNGFDIDINSAMWAFNTYTFEKQKYYGESHILRDQAWFDKNRQNANFAAYKTILKPAIILRDTAVRSFATKDRLFLDSRPGEGYPFDYLQDSNLEAFHPVLVSHFSLDGAWAFIQSDSFTGFVLSSDIKILNKKEADEFRKSKFAIFIKDGVAIKDKVGEFKFYSRIGGLVPYKRVENGNFITPQGYKISQDIATDKLELNSKNAKLILNEMLGMNYGWGGIDGLRDCSAFTKDYFASFGIWLPRNSKPQSQIAQIIDLKGLSDEEKKSKIVEFAVPYATLLYMRGHIMLYTGVVDGKISVTHASWGLKTKNNARAIIGRTAITDIEIGKDRDDIKALLLSLVESMNILAPNPKLALQNSYDIKFQNNNIIFANNSSMPYDEGDILNNPSIKDMFALKYPLLAPLNSKLIDAGRIRNERFFNEIYGQNKEAVEKNLVEVTWLKNSLNQKIKFNSINGAAKALQKVSDELDILVQNEPNLIIYLKDIGGTFKYRNIAQTNRLSAHSWGIAIDINVANSHYWLWHKDGYQNKIPYKIVEIFEKNGFIWGGRWEHFDTMHFEYRPEFAALYGVN
ncbi:MULTISPECIES: bifunctional C40 family peptidase/M15 family metallopeptidase [Campylobacter]|uniref:bifunctional C40 family peptidase/M15 family metallopeptidase n=1 Tax=Campylobacter TaxID=194 RepID=UPI000A349FA6|nr:M15 family metallopeptidase [Campylobacter sp. P0024]MCR8679441.1 M15 family metallopeptidase [Campylobacter sp. RM19072]